MINTDKIRKISNSDPLLNLNSSQTANILGIAEYTLRRSRTTGILFGVPAPRYRKLGRKVVYNLHTLEIWLEQFKPQNSTAQNIR